MDEASREAYGLRKMAEDQLGRMGHQVAADNSFVCKLPESAPREHKVGWLLSLGKHLLDKDLVTLPVLKWTGDTQNERDALERAGFLFASYEVSLCSTRCISVSSSSAVWSLRPRACECWRERDPTTLRRARRCSTGGTRSGRSVSARASVLACVLACVRRRA